MSVTERPSPVKNGFAVPAPSENVLIAIVVFVFLMLHVSAGMLLQRALPAAPAALQAELIDSSCD